jgi:calcium-dependent protein kinase
MMCGEPPFKGKDDNMILSQVTKAEISFTKTVWSGVSSEAKSLITSMVERNVKKRLSIDQVLTHHWFSSLTEQRQKNLMSANEHNAMLSCLSNIKSYKV